MSRPPDGQARTDPQHGEQQGIYLVLAAIVIIAIVGGGMFAYAEVVMRAVPQWQERGQFGDMFGALNAAFSGLAFCAIAYSLALQRTDLRNQQEELRLTRSEYSRAAAAQEHTQRAMEAELRLSEWTAEVAAVRLLLEVAREESARLKNSLPVDRNSQQVLDSAGRVKTLASQLESLLKRPVPSNASLTDTAPAVPG